MRFAPLHIRSGYSFLSSGLTVEKIVSNVLKNKYFGAAITDKNVMFGIPPFVTLMSKYQFPYLVALEIEAFHNVICLYALNEEGYLNLCKISTAIQKEEFDDSILKNSNQGIFAIIDTNQGEIKDKFLDVEVTEETLARYVNEISKSFNEFYLGVEIKERSDTNHAMKVRKFAKKYTYQTVAFPYIKYEKKEDAIVLDIVEAIKNDDTLELKEKSGNEHFFSIEDYSKIYTPDEMELSAALLEKSTFVFNKKRGELMKFSNDAFNLLKEKCYKELNNRGLNKEEYVTRLEYELSIINQMGYCDYFLLVQDYVLWAKDHDILTGARGSSIASLVAYLLNITNLDPIYYNLQFERFLNPARSSMPDIDIDFMDNRRVEVIDYCRQKYGKERVANIVTFQTILAKQALRDIGRIYNYPIRHIDLLSKSLSNSKLDLRNAYRKVPAFKELVDSDKYFLEIVSLAAKIEGLPRQSGMHAAGVVLDNSAIENHLPITVDFDNNPITQYEGEYLENQGFLKMDFLGLSHLTVVSDCVERINKAYNLTLNKFNIPFDEDCTYEQIRSSNVMGIFQLESSGMRNAINTLKPTSYDDIAALLALFRPGPMEFIPTYARRKYGKEKVPEMDERIAKILAPTYGIITYQEQVSELAKAMSGMSATEADNFRAAISKKKIALIASMHDKFIEGSVKNGFTKNEAEDYFKRMSKFAEYGFNKSHSYGYAFLSCEMAYLKAKYPLEFYATLLDTSSTNKEVKYSQTVAEIKRRGIVVRWPDINLSNSEYRINDKQLILPLTTIKGINKMTSDKIVEIREKNHGFTDFYDFVAKIFELKLTDTQLINIINSGAFDSLASSRASLRKSVERAIQYAEVAQASKDQNMFDFAFEKPLLIEDKDDPMLNLKLEYDAIGIMLSDNPLSHHRDLLNKLNATTISELIDIKDSLKERRSNEYTVAGIIRSKKTTKKDKPTAFIEIFDETGDFEATIFPDLYASNIQTTKKDNIIVMKGYFEQYKGSYSFIAKEINLLEEYNG